MVKHARALASSIGIVRKHLESFLLPVEMATTALTCTLNSLSHQATLVYVARSAILYTSAPNASGKTAANAKISASLGDLQDLALPDRIYGSVAGYRADEQSNRKFRMLAYVPGLSLCDLLI